MGNCNICGKQTYQLFCGECIDCHEVQEKKEAIALHFSINKSDIKQDPEDYDDEFLITFDAKAPNVPEPKYYLIEVVDESTAEVNEADFLEQGDNVENYKTNTCVGMYTRLLDSDYYFRWM